MNIRWRLSVLVLQLGLLALACWAVTGKPYAAETWYGAGMLALIINPQVLEPYYHSPGDVLANALLGLLLYLTARKQQHQLGWEILLAVLLGALVLGATALVFGAGRKEGKFVGIGRAAAVISKVATSRALYSTIFWLALLDILNPNQREFWILGGAWAAVTVIGLINWQAAWGSISGGPMPCSGEGMIGPSFLFLSSPSLPIPGTPVHLKSDGCSADGFVLNRIHRDTDFWGQVHIDDASKCEVLARKKVITLTVRPEGEQTVIGAVLAPSTDTQLQFVSSRDLEIGTVVSVKAADTPVLYQIRWAEIEETKVKGGAHQVVRAHASQLGIFDSKSLRLGRHRWVPAPGGAVNLLKNTPFPISESPKSSLQLGFVLGTGIPVFLDCVTACQGHVAILGMTRMGKTTLALRLASHLAAESRVTILDQTGEWVAKKGLARYAGSSEDSTPGISVLEPKPGAIAPTEALKYLKSWVNLAFVEYKSGTPLSRVLIIDEAHQFVPEPAGLSFGSPGRDSAIEFGLLMMQVRKYGITVILISQRTAVVAKSALSQCENLVAFKSVDQTGLEYLEAILGADARKALPSLRHGEALAFGPAISSDLPAGIAVMQS